MADVGVLNLQIKSNAGSAATSLGNLADALSRVKSAVGRGALANNIGNVATALERLKQSTQGGLNSRTLSSITKSIADATKQLDTASVNRLKTAADAIERYVNSYKSMSGVGTAGKTHLGRIPLNLGQFGEKNSGLVDVKGEVQSQVQDALQTAKTGDSIKEITKNTEELKGSLQEAGNAAENLKGSLKSIGDDGKGKGGFISTLGKLKEGISNLQMPFAGLLSSFARIAKYRMLRAIIKSISEGVKEGVENVYKYSQAVGTSFAPTMDSLASTMSQFKNSLGAAVSPALQALIPVLNQIVNAAISVINVLNQLFALLGGRGTWTRALPVATQAFNETKKAAGGAGKAINEMLASFDELNVIASESGGGGGGGGGALADFENMFEEMYVFDEKIRDFVDWLRDNMESIKGIAIAIGAAILSWKLANAFAEVLPTLSHIFGFVATGAVIAITLQVTWLLTNRYLETGEIGWLFADILTTAVGATAAAVIAKKLIGGTAAAAYTASFTLTLSAVTGIVALLKDVDTGALSKEGLAVALENALKVGAAASILMKFVGGATTGAALAGGAAAAAVTFGVVVGLKASLDPKVELFSPAYLITAVASSVLAGFGAYLFMGSSAVAFGVGALVTFGALVAIKLLTSSNSIEWGDVHLTERQIENFVEKKMFRIDVKASIERINTTVEATAFNRTELEKEVSKLIGDMKLIKLGLADDQDYADMQKQVDSIINRVHTMAESSENLAKLTLQFTPSLVGDTEQEQGDWFTSFTEGWDKVDDWFQKKGKELGGYFVENEKGEIIASKPELIAAVLQQISDVAAAASKYRAGQEAYSELLLGIGDLDQATAKDVIEKYKGYVEELRSTLEASAKEQIAAQASLVGMLYEIDPNSSDYLEAKAKLEEMTANLVKGVEKDLENAIGPGRDLIMEWIFGNHAKGSISSGNVNPQILKDVGKTVDEVKAYMHGLLQSGGVDKLEIEAMDLIGFTGWELLTAELQSEIVKYAVLSPDTIKALQEYLKLDVNDIISMSGWEEYAEIEKMQFINSLARAYGESAMSQIKGKVGNIKVSDVLSVSGWENWSVEEQKQYIKSLEAAFGSNAVQNTLRGLGNNVPKWVAEGIQKRDELKTALNKIAKQLKEAGITSQEILEDWDLTAPIIDNYDIEESTKIIEEIVETCGKDSKAIMRNWNLVAPEVSGLKIKDSLAAAKQIAQQTGVDINDILSKWNLISPKIDPNNITSSAKYISDLIIKYPQTWQDELAKNLTAPGINVPSGWGANVINAAQNLANNVKAAIETINPTINVRTVLSAIVNVTANIETAQGKIINTSATGAINLQNSISSFANKLGWYGSGAYDIPNGQIFVAGEDGPELIGTMNGNTTVANQGQIIEGIAAGVAASNEEQNVLLREQNNLLRQILQKDTSVRLGASSALGRTVKKSLDMYSMATGEA